MAENSIERVNVTTLANKKLNNYVGQIARAALNMQTQTLKVAYIVAQIAKEELWKDDFDSFDAFGLAILGKKKATLYNMVKVGSTWVDKNGHTIFYDGETDYTASQLYQIMRIKVAKDSESMPQDIAWVWHDTGKINYLMSCAELKEIVDDWNAQFKKASADGTTKEKGKKGKKAKVKADAVFTVEHAFELMRNEQQEYVISFEGQNIVVDAAIYNSAMKALADTFKQYAQYAEK